MSTTLTIRQQIAPRPGTLYSTDPRSLTFTQGSLFSFPLHSTAYESDAATIRIPAGIKLCIHTVSVDRKEMTEFVKSSSAHGVCLKFSWEENGEMLVVWIGAVMFGRQGWGLKVWIHELCICIIQSFMIMNF